MKAINYTRGYVQVDLDAVQNNIEQAFKNIDEDTKIMLVIKADGYGHGANTIATTFENNDRIWGFGVATMDEGILLRNSEIKKPILVLGCVFPEQYAEAIANNLSMNVYNEDMAIRLSQSAVLTGGTAKVHIKLDTGMSRLGFFCNEETISAIVSISTLPNLALEGIFTHFAKADETDKTFTLKQFQLFYETISLLEEKGVSFKYKHCANSAAIIDHPEYKLDIVRLGISLYGLYPSDEVKKSNALLKPALSFFSTIASVKEIPKGTQVSYGGTFMATKNMRIAMIPIGYADGYPRSLSNKGYVLIEGMKAPILGRICMDQFMVDITHIPEATFMTPVVLIGASYKKKIEVEELSALSDKFNYEFVCGISKRIPRVYMKDGVMKDQIDYFA
ncbi:MAG: alanine racemase [Eubacteriales bacterium]